MPVPVIGSKEAYASQDSVAISKATRAGLRSAHVLAVAQTEGGLSSACKRAPISNAPGV